MSPSAQHHAINYIEFTSTDITKTKAFYERVFSWNFQDYGPDYIAFDKDHAGIDGGFRKGDPGSSGTRPQTRGPPRTSGCARLFLRGQRRRPRSQ